MSISWRHVASSICAVWPNPPIPATLHNISSRPRHLRAVAISASHDAASPASNAKTALSVARLPAVRIAPSRLRSAQITSAPSVASRTAVARPIPDAAPVTSATLPFKPFIDPPSRAVEGGGGPVARRAGPLCRQNFSVASNPKVRGSP